MDHVIVTNYEGDIAIYRGPELAPLIREVLDTEFDLSPFEMEDPDPEFDPALIEVIRNPSIATLTVALESLDVDLFYSGPPHTITVTDSTPGAVPRTYTAPTLPGLIREVLLAEFDIAPVDMDLAPDEFPHEITECWRVPTVPALRLALDPFATLEHTY